MEVLYHTEAEEMQSEGKKRKKNDGHYEVDNKPNPQVSLKLLMRHEESFH